MNLNVPFVDLKAQYAAIRMEIDAAVKGVMESGQFVGGQVLERFEEEFAEFIGADFAVGVGNGTDAITLALRAAGIGRGDEVLVPANSFFASAEAVSNAGATPIFVDVTPRTFLMDPQGAAEGITSRTRAILPVHLYGRAVDMRPLEELAAAHNLMIVEDCAQAHGASIGGRIAGASGRLTCFSFYPGKNLGAYGDGGAITTSDPEMNRRLRMLRDHGSAHKYDHEMIGYNSRLDAIQAAVLSVKLRYLAQWNEARRKHAETYAAAFADSPVLPPEILADSQQVFHLFVVRCCRRNDLQQYLSAQGIATGIHYPIPLHLSGAYCKPGVAGVRSCPVAELLAGEILSLPMFAELTDEQLKYVIDAVQEFARKESPAVPSDIAFTSAGR
ncbi:MAG: DegT/DnrJ/EryC1/StrS family aminotransferase [Terracidiphilus sp.]|jgi:dTDP-4-amino-4,6-dideoxygalactose transaminase